MGFKKVITLIILFSFNLKVLSSEFKSDITFTFGDDNILRGSGETRRNSPAAYFGNIMGTPLDRAFPSDIKESILILSIKGRLDSHNKFVPEGSVLLNYNLYQGKFFDKGTFFRLNYYLKKDEDKRFHLDFYPVNSNMISLGFYPELMWGTEDTFPRNFRSGPVPGFKFGYIDKKFYSFFGMKTALIRSPSEDILDNIGSNINKIVERTNYGFLGGFGINLIDGLVFEMNGGYFQKGTNNRSNVLGKPIPAGGISLRLEYNYGLKIGEEISARFYFMKPWHYSLQSDEEYDKKLSFSLSFEITELVQTLEDPDHIHSTKNEYSKGLGFIGKIKYSFLRIYFISLYRDLTYIVFNVPGFVPYQALSRNVDVTPELYNAITLDYYFSLIGITFSISGGIIIPATYKGTIPEGQNLDEVSLGIRKVVVMGSDSSQWNILPEGEDELPIFMTRFTIKWAYLKNFISLLEIFYEKDANTAQVFRDSKGHAIRSFDKPDILGIMFLSRLIF